LAALLLDLFKEAGVLDGDHCLVGECLNKGDLIGLVRLSDLATERNVADATPLQ